MIATSSGWQWLVELAGRGLVGHVTVEIVNKHQRRSFDIWRKHTFQTCPSGNVGISSVSMMPPGHPLMTNRIGSFPPSARIVKTAVIRYECFSPPEIFDEPPRTAYVRGSTLPLLIILASQIIFDGISIKSDCRQVFLCHFGHGCTLSAEAMTVRESFQQTYHSFAWYFKHLWSSVQPENSRME
ncbi:hypothetical protein Ae201684_014825 [Aphanomyces euteiches]|uniref:Uncharacterized protein n=1 Tax=Aphanomyces euteiches TaxID=100861 RepID=A0A6G0WIP2_9STRA|nr:hypothetical protein Ae201684_014825 [Aphanomyces euteiches]